MIPYFPGQWFPQANDPSTRTLYCASMLALLQPWRSLFSLKAANTTFQSTYDTFCEHASARTQKIIDNIQYFHKTSDKVLER